MAFELPPRQTSVHTICTALRLPLPIHDAFSFFGDAWNLERITPPELHFHITTPKPIVMKTGTLIDYRLRLLGVPLLWKTVISVWEPPRRFIDKQLQGPYAMWVHEHAFQEEDGETVIRDTVRFRLPLWPAGEAALPLVAHELRRIFSYRQKKTAAILLRSDIQADSSIRLTFYDRDQNQSRIRTFP